MSVEKPVFSEFRPNHCSFLLALLVLHYSFWWEERERKKKEKMRNHHKRSCFPVTNAFGTAKPALTHEG